MASPSDNAYGGKGPLLISLGWFWFAIGIVSILFRILITIHLPRSVRYSTDLWPLLVATALAISSQPFLVKAAHNGIGNNSTYVDLAHRIKAFLWHWCYITIALISIVAMKLSYIALLRQLLLKARPTACKIFVIIGAIQLLIAISAVILIWLQCSPVSRSGAIYAYTTPYCTYNQALLRLLMVQGGISALVDIGLGTYTFLTLQELQLPKRDQLKLVLFYISTFSGVILAIVRILQVKLLTHSTNPLGPACLLMIWFHVEQWMAICISTIPRLRTLLSLVKNWKHDKMRRLNLTSTLSDSENLSASESNAFLTPMEISHIPDSVRQRIQRHAELNRVLISANTRLEIYTSTHYDVRHETVTMDVVRTSARFNAHTESPRSWFLEDDDEPATNTGSASIALHDPLYNSQRPLGHSTVWASSQN